VIFPFLIHVRQKRLVNVGFWSSYSPFSRTPQLRTTPLSNRERRRDRDQPVQLFPFPDVPFQANGAFFSTPLGFPPLFHRSLCVSPLSPLAPFLHWADGLVFSPPPPLRLFLSYPILFSSSLLVFLFLYYVQLPFFSFFSKFFPQVKARRFFILPGSHNRRMELGNWFSCPSYLSPTLPDFFTFVFFPLGPNHRPPRMLREYVLDGALGFFYDFLLPLRRPLPL